MVIYFYNLVVFISHVIPDFSKNACTFSVNKKLTAFHKCADVINSCIHAVICFNSSWYFLNTFTAGRVAESNKTFFVPAFSGLVFNTGSCCYVESAIIGDNINAIVKSTDFHSSNVQTKVLTPCDSVKFFRKFINYH